MPRAELGRAVRRSLVTSLLALGFFLLQPPAFAQTCAETCGSDYSSCQSSCDWQYQDCTNGGWWGCDQQRNDCYNSCDSQYNSCLAGCGPPEPPPPPPPGDGHIWCDGWNRQGDCAYNHIGVATGSEFKRFRGGGPGYFAQTFLTWHPAEFDGFGRFTEPDGNVGIISTSQLAGQVPLHRWSTQRGFYYSIYYTNHGNDYVYGGIAGYVWPPGTNLGFPLYQFYNQTYGHFYASFAREIFCQPPGTWAVQGEMARVNWPAPFPQTRICFNNGGLFVPPSCDPFDVEACRRQGRFFDFSSCLCL